MTESGGIERSARELSGNVLVQLIAILREELHAYRSRAREAVLSFGGLCIAIAYFALGDTPLTRGAWVVVAVTLVIAALVVSWFLVLSRKRGAERRDLIDDLVEHFPEPACRFTLKLRRERESVTGTWLWHDSITFLYIVLVVAFALVTLALTYDRSWAVAIMDL